MSKISQNRVITFDNQSIKNLNPDIIYVGGDIVHSKTQEKIYVSLEDLKQ